MRAAVYCRISRDDGTALGIARQRKDCEQLCADRSWEVVEVFEDNNRSATKGEEAKRPSYDRMCAGIRSGQFDVVVAWKNDRLHRSPGEFETFLKLCKKAELHKVATTSGEFDPITGDGLLEWRIRGDVAAEETRKLAERSARKHLELAERGAFHGGGAPFGYDVQKRDKAAGTPNALVVNPAEAEIVRECTRRVLEGETLYAIHRSLIARGVVGKTGGRLVKHTIKKFLLSPAIAGLREHHGAVTEAAWEAIITREDHEQLKAILTDESRNVPPRTKSYPLRGVLVCGECGARMVSASRSGKRMYGCTKDTGGCARVWQSADPLEAYVFGVVIPLADSPAMRDHVAADTEAQATEIRTLLAEQAADEARLAEIADMLAVGDIDRAGYTRAAKKLQSRLDGRTGRLHELRGTSALDRLGGSVADSWESLTADERRTIVMSLVGKITIKRVGRSGRFSPARVGWTFRWAQLAKAAEGIVLTDADLAQWEADQRLTAS